VSDGGRWVRVRAVFDEVVGLPEGEREAGLAARCEGDETLRTEVRSLLAADAAAGAALGAAVASAAEALAEAPPRLPERIGNYRVLEELGRGGMGVVYRAERDDDSYRGQVAIKLISRHLSGADARRRFLVERQILADLDHPSIAKLLDGGTTEDGQPYLVMELIDGEPIDAYLREAGLGLEARLALVAEVADAVSHAHSRLVVHRDLKPANILITAAGRPKLLDFGIAKILDQEGPQQTRMGALPMTPEYASPEQVSGGPIGVQTDVYSLGVVLYELLTGVSPYGEARGSSPLQLSRAIGEIEPPLPSVAVRTEGSGERRVPPVAARLLAGDLDAIVATALRKDGTRRYASVERFAADLRAFLAREPVAARVDSWHYRAGKWLQRNAPVAVLGGVAVAALVGGLLAASAQARRADREAARASAEAARASSEAARAGRQAAVAEEVSGFLEGLFAATDPSAARGREVTARELLDRGVTRIDEGFGNQPLVQARLLHAMGEAYGRLGHFATAETLLGRALALRRGNAEAAPLAVARTHMSLVQVLKETQRPEEAEAQVRAAIALYEASTEPAGRLLAAALAELATVLNRQMKLAEAEAALLQASALLDQLPEPDPELAASLALKLGSLYADQGKPEQALGSLERALGLARELHGLDHPRTVVALNNVGQARIELGRAADAEGPLREALPVARKLLEPHHPLIGAVLRNLGGSLARQGSLDEAEPLLREALANHAAAYGEEHFLTQLASTSLGIVELRRGRFEEAGRRFARARAVIEPVFGADHLVVGELHQLEGEAHAARGNAEAARESLARALEIRERILGAEGVPVRETRVALAGIAAPR
jgi:tetratricopeptide (TPR) repeat protein